MGPRDWQRAKTIMEAETPSADVLMQELGRLIVSWNNLEGMARLIVQLLCEGTKATEFLIHSLDAASIEDTIRATGHADIHPEISDSLKDFAGEMGALRKLRNEYVHASSETPHVEGKTQLRLTNKTVRGKLKVFDHMVTRYDMWLTSEAINQVQLWGFDIASWLFLHQMGKPTSSLPQKGYIPEYRKFS